MKRYVYHYCADSLNYVFDGIIAMTEKINSYSVYQKAKDMILSNDYGKEEVDYAYLRPTLTIRSLTLLDVLDDDI